VDMCAAAERGVDVNAVERLPHPTRDVLVVRALDGDRTFAGFGKASTTPYHDTSFDCGLRQGEPIVCRAAFSAVGGHYQDHAHRSSLSRSRPSACAAWAGLAAYHAAWPVASLLRGILPVMPTVASADCHPDSEPRIGCAYCCKLSFAFTYVTLTLKLASNSEPDPYPGPDPGPMPHSDLT